MNILFFGDIVGRIGLEAVASTIKKIRKDYSVDFVIANGENCSRGKGLTEKDCFDLLNLGVDVITLGNHYRSKSQIDEYIDDVESLIRPINLKDFQKGSGSSVFTVNNVDIRVTNVLGQGLMNNDVYSPVETLDKLLSENPKCIHIVDFHGESTSEKKTFAYYLDGRVSAVLGTHTHVQTNDEVILPNGTAFISDAGMCGAANSVIGFSKESVIDKFIYNHENVIQINNDDKKMVNAVVMAFDEETFECLDIEKIKIIEGER